MCSRMYYFFYFQQKRHWRRYIYLWIKYALFEELQAEDMERTREVYRTALSIIPHKCFSFAKMWLLFAKFEIRQKNLTAARKIMVGTEFSQQFLFKANP